MVDRIRQLIQARQLSPTQFADTIGVARPIVSHILGGRNKPSLEVIQKIIAAFPDLSMPWLLTGQGPMLAEASNVAPDESSSPSTAPVAPAAPRRSLRAANAAATSSPKPKPIEVVEEPAAPTPVVEQAPAQRVAEDASPQGDQSKGVAAPPSAMHPAPVPAIAQVIPGQTKTIRRVVIFYSDGTFSDYSPAFETSQHV